jgi:hypothetical protein
MHKKNQKSNKGKSEKKSFCCLEGFVASACLTAHWYSLSSQPA